MKEFIKNNKRITTISLLAFVVVLSITIIVINTTKAGGEVKIDGDLYITDVSSKYDNGIYKFTGKLFTKSNTVEVKSVDITLTSGSNSVTLHGYVDQEIEYGEEVDVIAYSDTDYSKYKASYKVNYITDEEPSSTEGSETEGSGN